MEFNHTSKHPQGKHVEQKMEKTSMQRIVFSSSCTVYGQPQTAEVTEETPIQNATSPYGDTKITCEK